MTPRMVTGITGNLRNFFQNRATLFPNLSSFMPRPVQMLISDARVDVRIQDVHHQVHHKNYDSYQ